MTRKVTFITFNSESNLLFSCGKDRALVKVIPKCRHDPLVKIELCFLEPPGHVISIHASTKWQLAKQSIHPEWAVHHFQEFLHPTLRTDFACLAVASSLCSRRTKLFVFGAFQMVNFLVATRATTERWSGLKSTWMQICWGYLEDLY